MSLLQEPLIVLGIWALATMALAPLPMKYQMLPGLALLLVLPVLLIWIGQVHGFLPVLIGLAAAMSLFRKPLGVLLRRLSRGFR